jgi:hypothetical protein
MSENIQNPTAATQGQQPAAPAPKPKKRSFVKPTAADKKAKSMFDSVEAAKASPPDNKNYRLYVVRCPGGATFYTWETSHYGAVYNSATAHGYAATRLDKPAADPRAVLAGLSDEQLAAMGLARVAPAAATVAAPGAEPTPAALAEEPVAEARVKARKGK